jgi:hypothetical protein
MAYPLDGIIRGFKKKSCSLQFAAFFSNDFAKIYNYLQEVFHGSNTSGQQRWVTVFINVIPK